LIRLKQTYNRITDIFQRRSCGAGGSVSDRLASCRVESSVTGYKYGLAIVISGDRFGPFTLVTKLDLPELSALRRSDVIGRVGGRHQIKARRFICAHT